jgi:hypothetical protein
MSVAIEDLPCMRCSTPQGAHIRYRLGQAGEIDEAQRSPFTGLPVDCCRIHSTPIVQHADPPSS